MALIDKIRLKQDEIMRNLADDKEENLYFSFEYFPPKFENGLQGLYSVLDKMTKKNPMWIDVTWGA